MNLTKEIIDETSILYREDPIYKVVDETGKISKNDQELWEDIMRDSRYFMTMDKLDRWTRLLGTMLVKVSFIDENTGELVKETEAGKVQLDLLHGGTYDIRSGASPYYITELLIGFGRGFSGFGGNSMVGAVGQTTLSNHNPAAVSGGRKVKPGQISNVDRIYWSPDSHKVEDKEGNFYETENPYGVVPAVPFFNQDPAHYYFLPINEPLIYANHALNMRISDLNHIAKFQSFGVPVVTGIERPTSLRQGRPVDDFNLLKGGGAQSQFGGLSGISGFGAGGSFRSFDAGLGINRDGNADANALGMSIGPDTAIAVGEKGDFKFAHPSADIKGLISTIEGITDMVRINHGLRPKYKDTLPSSGFALMMEKMGVMEDNIRRAKLFKEREQQLFYVIKQLWNKHHNKTGQRKFSDKCRLEVIHKEPTFPVDPKTKMEAIAMENNLLDSGDTETYKKIYMHLSDSDIRKLIKKRRKDKEEQVRTDTELLIEQAKMVEQAGFDPGAFLDKQIQEKDENKELNKTNLDNKAKHSEDSSKQQAKNGDPRKKENKNKRS